MTDSTGEGPARSALLSSYALFVVVAGILALSFATSPFKVSNVEVTGAGRFSGEVMHASHIRGRNIFTIRSSSIVSDLRVVPNILVTGVSISLPNVVSVRVQVPRALFAWRQKNGLFLIDRYGRLMARVGASRLPIIHNNTVKRIDLGQYVGSDVVVAAQYARKELRKYQIEGFSLDMKRGLVIQSRQGWKAVMGLPKGKTLVARVAVLQQLLHNTAASHRTLSFVDLRKGSTHVAFSR